ncbi:hypothetical protein GCM10010371_49830 [Streptomyces subrutilus]|uniref:DUF3152 domain-containing protein n=1 Tax=Streptomyces subrutilus TaxID=36818 RepID=A0A5P2UQE5_9ACTN|nr:DUF3152 domain-containing protein [Streptomyces subrutilus]QEU78917.1 DUF3152 domain-containing protein [Streptomyces subrutilus]GGZ84017.1 hypothetical protein GCM10010371_49830 [Streptomyces subrutilus]
MGRHSRKDPAPARPEPAPGPAGAPEPAAAARTGPPAYDGPEGGPRDDPHDDRYDGPFARRRSEPTVAHQGYAPRERPAGGARSGGHPEQREPGGGWGAGPDSVFGASPRRAAPHDAPVHGDRRGVPRARSAAAQPAGPQVPAGVAPAPVVPAPAAPVVAATAAVLDAHTPAFGTPAVGFPQVTLPTPPLVVEPGPDPLTSTGPHPRVPGPRRPGGAAGAGGGAEGPERAEPAGPDAPRSGSGRGLKVRTYTGMAAAAVTTVLAVVVAGQVAADGDGAKTATASAPGGAASRASDSHVAGSRSEDRLTPDGAAQPPAAAVEPTYEQKMAQQLPIDAKLAGPGGFDTVPGVAKAPGKGKLIRYRVDVEQGLGLDPQLFAEAVHRTLNDPRSWGHGDTKTFERVPGGEADFVITLASPGTTGAWCAKSGLDTTVDNVSCDSAATDRVMINAFRWAQGSVTFGADQMFAYRQMLINHEVGHRLGHGHVSCRTPGALAPIMQQQTKSLDIDGVQCRPNPWVYPGG